MVQTVLWIAVVMQWDLRALTATHASSRQELDLAFVRNRGCYRTSG